MTVLAPRSRTARPTAMAWLRALLVALAAITLAAPSTVADPSAPGRPSGPPSSAAPAQPSGPVQPSSTGDVRMSARPLLGANVRPGAWMAVRVHLENDGPSIDGELRIAGGQQGESRYGTVVQLPTGARQELTLYAQPAWFGARLTVSLVSGGHTLATEPLRLRSVDPWTPTIVIVAEHPESIAGDVRIGSTSPILNPPVVLMVASDDLPARVEAWSAIDRLVWQDVDSSTLEGAQLDALRAWLGAGGQLVIVGGLTGQGPLAGFPRDLLPYAPERTIDVPVRDLEGMLGTLPLSATGLPALAGVLDRGSVLGRSGDAVFAAQRPVGQGSVTLLGIDPGAAWLRGTPAATALWHRLLPATSGPVLNPLVLQDDVQVVNTLDDLPAVNLPDIAVLLVLLLLYVALIGPVNYLVLRHFDRREWAWVTMPALVTVFAVAAYALGVNLKGTDVIVNQVGIVRTAAGTDRGIGQYYVGIFSPTRATYQVTVADGALLTNPTYLAQQGATTTPLDVLSGDVSRIRDFHVGFAVVRPFRAEANVAVPRLDADLAYSDGRLTGTITNRSTLRLEALAVTFGGAVRAFDSLEPGASMEVALDLSTTRPQGPLLSESIFGPLGSAVATTRRELARRQIIDQLTYYSDTLGGYGSIQQGPVVLAWSRDTGIGVGLDTAARQVADTLHLYPASVRISGQTVFTNPLLTHAVVESAASEALDRGTDLYLSRGSMVVQFRPMGFSGAFAPTTLALALTLGELRPVSGMGPEIVPLPDAEQPAQDDPLTRVATARALGGGVDAGASPAPPRSGLVVGDDIGDALDGRPANDPAFFDGIPDLQLYDRAARRWVEFPHPRASREFRIASPARYVDDTGAFLVRFVNRSDDGQTVYFTLVARLEGEAR